MMKTSGFDKIVGTGGIGTGQLFLSDKMGTLKRSESRPVRLSKAKDYCKQHIVFYYASAFAKEKAAVYPIGYVGNDEPGHELIREMQAAGMHTDYVGVSRENPTMVSVCLQYPDKEGCNITAINNAMTEADSQYIERCMEEIKIDNQTITAVIPEVAVESRLTMLKKGREGGAFNVLSVPVSEADLFLEDDILKACDFLAVNQEEAQALLKKELSGKELVRKLYLFLEKLNPNIHLLITCGSDGAYTAVKSKIESIPPFKGKVTNTTGAGDAFLGGTLAGLARGLPLQKGKNDTFFGESELTSAAELGALCAGMAIEYPDSIALPVTPGNVKERIKKNNWRMKPWFII